MMGVSVAPSGGEPASKEGYDPTKGKGMNIYVGNLSYDTTEQGLRAAFEGYGDVASVSIITDRQTGQSRGFGFVEMPDRSEALAAIDGLNEQELDGRRLRVNEARPREDRRGGGGRRGGGRRGGGRRQGGRRRDDFDD
jgi:cold-inducible RNA-binding protein